MQWCVAFYGRGGVINKGKKKKEVRFVVESMFAPR